MINYYYITFFIKYTILKRYIKRYNNYNAYKNRRKRTKFNN